VRLLSSCFARSNVRARESVREDFLLFFLSRSFLGFLFDDFFWGFRV
jgi:hypothetical protein